MLSIQLSPPPFCQYLASLFKSIFLFCVFGNTIGIAQSFQNPYWVISSDPPKLFKNSGILQQSTLPFSQPMTYIHSAANHFWRHATGANGMFTQCGTPIFYISGDWVFDENGLESGYLLMKDYSTKAQNPYTGIGFNLTENFEQVVCPVPSNPNEYFIFTTDSYLNSQSASFLFVQKYNTISNTLSFPTLLFQFSHSPLRLALSKPNVTGNRVLYAYDGKQLRAFPISSVVQQSQLVYNKPGDPFSVAPEMELSHDGSRLAWAEADFQQPIPYFRIKVFQLPSSSITTVEPYLNAFNYVSGLEFLPDGRLAASIDWNGAANGFDGIGYFNANFTGYSYIPNTSAYNQGMIELGLSSPSSFALFGTSGTRICRINGTNNSSLALSSTFLISTAKMYSNTYPNNLVLSVYGLPDQIDGEQYPQVSCGGNETESIYIEVEEGSPPTIDLQFTPEVKTR